ncbi:MAG TPA: aldehyde ferredoxin oxidoreductase family protein [Spirochaetota bacterium]|nr:MAG: putative oxidoreductase YdhV [Spirochaetes bacterium ADurb.Bin133]HPY88849.1 aldehyde ferredoxin oxidoreductase family protein [Spirochaetota bacterium]
MEIIGTSNKFLEIDVKTKISKIFDIDETLVKKYLGGKGLGLKILYDRMNLQCDPLGDENMLVFSLGVMLGTGAPCSARWSCVSKSPLTGIMCHSSCGGPFGMALKTAGYDGLIVTGASDSPVNIFIDGAEVKFQDASSLWGLTTTETQEKLALGKDDGECVIGPAGENKVLYANIKSGHRYLGRGGFGAIMGAKKIKAIVVKGKKYTIKPVDEVTFSKTKKIASKYINQNKFTSDSYRKYGTTYNVRICNKAGLLPVNNFRYRTDERSEEIAGENMAKKYDTKPSPCKPCLIVCGHKGKYPDGKTRQIPEYETAGLFGPNLGIYDSDKIAEWNDLCNDMGLDTISTAGTISYIMEATEKKLIASNLKFGSVDRIEDFIKDVAYRRGLGDEAANGSKRLAQKYGGKEFAINVKGLEMAAYDPRGAWGQGLNYAVANRGGCHLSSFVVATEAMFRYLNSYTTYGKHYWVYFFENLYSAVNSLHTCLFTGFAYILERPLVRFTPKPILSVVMRLFPIIAINLMDWSIFSSFYSSITGYKTSMREFLKAGKRIHILERYMNNKIGIAREDDSLPERFLTEDESDYKRKSKVPLNAMLNKYYKLRGYDDNGIPTAKTLKKAEIKDDK